MIRNKAGFFMGEREREGENEREGGGREGALPTVDIVKGGGSSSTVKHWIHKTDRILSIFQYSKHRYYTTILQLLKYRSVVFV